MVPLLPEFPQPLLFAHRGCSSLAPENTMASFQKAKDSGAPGIELDIHVTADGKLVVAHDDTFTRTAPPDNNGGGKKPEELSYDEIRRIDVGSFFGPQWSKEHPPLLEDVLEAFCPALYVDIELKSRKAKGDPLPGLLAEKLRALGKKISAAVTISSFNPFCLKTFKREWRTVQNSASGGFPDIPAAIIWCADRELPWILRRGFGRILSGCDYLKPIHKQITGFPGALSRFWWSVLEKRPIVPWTVDDPSLAQKLFAPGPAGIPPCAGIITNRPQDIAASMSIQLLRN